MGIEHYENELDMTGWGTNDILDPEFGIDEMEFQLTEEEREAVYG